MNPFAPVMVMFMRYPQTSRRANPLNARMVFNRPRQGFFEAVPRYRGPAYSAGAPQQFAGPPSLRNGQGGNYGGTERAERQRPSLQTRAGLRSLPGCRW